ncbi:MAG: DALR domain-containing protein, partial [Planctomycetota bacterium]
LDEAVVKQLSELKERFEEAMNDDLNTAVALSVVFDLVRATNSLLEAGNASAETLGAVDDMFARLGGDVLGVVKESYAPAGQAEEKVIDGLVGILIAERSQARERKDFVTADAIRDKLNEIGIALEDKTGETTWRRK